MPLKGNPDTRHKPIKPDDPALADKAYIVIDQWRPGGLFRWQLYYTEKFRPKGSRLFAEGRGLNYNQCLFLANKEADRA